MPLEDRFWKKVSPEPNSGCWLWDACCDGGGYGIMSYGPRELGCRRAHIIAYELMIGPVPDGLELDHKCRVRCCVNPDHLEAVTHAENMARAKIAACRRGGHPYTEENTYLGRDGRRECRTCMKQRKQDRA